MKTSQSDRIEKQILLRVPPARVWRALSDSAEFGHWFRAKLDGPFAAGRRVNGQVTYPGYEHLRFEVQVERMEAEKYFSFRWHPFPSDPQADYSKETPTLVEFRLEKVAEGTRLSVIESGFDQLPAERRDQAFRANEGGWKVQLENIRVHVAG